MTAAPSMREQGLEELFHAKYGPPAQAGWGPKQRLRFGYYTPDDVYEGTVARFVTPGCVWLDVGCGRDIFPNNVPMTRQLAARCRLLFGVDPSDNIHENPFVHERAQTTLDGFDTDHRFDVMTLRMVAEHIENPEASLRTLTHVSAPHGRVIVYTINRWSPVSILSAIIPFRFHHAIKAFFWRTEEKDTFPVAYRMNTRAELRKLFDAAGFREIHFEYLDDCRTTARFRFLNQLELRLQKLLRTMGIAYPENCLLGVYEKCD